MAATPSPVTLITGGSSGIGAATVHRLLKDGHRVATTGRDADKLARLTHDTAESDDRLLTLPGDAADHEAVTEAVDATLRQYGRLDNAIANAGFATFESLADSDPERLRSMVLTNVLGPVLLAKAALPALTEAGGRLILVGSVAGTKNSPGNIYGVTKWAVHGLAENLRMLVTGDGVGVTLIAPGRVDTPFFDGSGRAPGPQLTPESIAQSIAWAVAQPEGTDVNQIVIRPAGQPN
jgi:NADP-dependent 3-hydroxy acid dehydrogenase YdfG